MSVITTGNSPKFLWPGLNAVWGRDYREHAREYTDLFDIETSEKNYEEDVEATGFGLVPIATEGASTTYDSESQQTVTRYTHVEYKLGFIVTRAERDDNLYEKKGVTRTQALAFSFRQTEEYVAANVYNRGQTSGYNGGDGVVLSSIAHPSLSGNQSNRLTTAADLSEASLEDSCIQIMNTVNNRGLRIGLMPKTLIIPPALAFDAQRILKSVQQSGTPNNDINAMKVMGSIPEIAVNHYLSDTDAYFIRTNAPSGMKFFRRVPTEFAQDGEFDTDNIKYKGYSRFSVGWSDWRALYTNGFGA